MTGICVISLVHPLHVDDFGRHAQAVLDQLRPEDQWIIHLRNLTTADRHGIEALLMAAAKLGRLPPQPVMMLESSDPITRAQIHAAARSGYVLALDVEDCLVKGALASITSSIELSGHCDLLYGDEVWKATNSSTPNPFFKSAWAPFNGASLFHSQTRPVVSTAALESVDDDVLPSDWAAFALKLATSGRKIRHIPVILTSHRGHPPRRADSARPSLSSITKPRRLSIVVPSTGRPAPESEMPMVMSLVGSVEATLSPDADVQYVIVCDEGFPSSTVERLRGLVRRDLRLIEFHREAEQFNFACMANLGALESDGDVLVFLNDDVELLTNRWDEVLARLAVHESIGAIGVQLEFPDGSRQHDGLTTQLIDGGLPIHSSYMRPAELTGHGGLLNVTREVMAVTGAFMAIERWKFLRAGGFSRQFPNNYNDIDLCFKLRTDGLRTVVTPQVQAIHKESQTRPQVRELSAEVAIQSRWNSWTVHDPHWNPNIAHEDSYEKPDSLTWSRGAPFLASRHASRDEGQLPSPEPDGDQAALGLVVWASIRERRVLQRRTPCVWSRLSCGT